MSDVRHSFDVLVVGGGPAGIAAAVCAAESGGRVGLADDNPALGGQIWRGEETAPGTNATRSWYRRFEDAKVEYLRGHRIFGASDDQTLLSETSDACHELKFDKLILATGARERFLPFPGWTLPNVMGAGGLQALVKSGVPVKGRHVVVAGTGPLLLAVAAYLKQHGAEVRAIAEQAAWGKLLRFSAGLIGQPGKIAQALSLRRQLGSTDYITGCWPIAAEGDGKLQSVTLRSGSKTVNVPCDYLACGFHLVPNVELPVLLGCVLGNDFVRVDRWQQTTVRKVYCAGEPTGIGGLELSLIEGEIAGYSAAGATAKAEQLFTRRSKLQKFATRMDAAFALNPALRSLATDETLVCRCEDVELKRLKEHDGWRGAKLHTRCGMGPCQGRICGSAVDFLLGWKVESVRPPIFPARVESLAACAELAGKH